MKISGDEKYFVYCDLVEENNSLLSRENNAARVMPSKLLAVAPKSESGVYPELLIPADKRVINNITLCIENEKFEVPDFNDEEIIYVLKISPGIFVFFEFQIFSGFPLLPEGKMKIHLQTKRGLNTLKFGACSEILTLILRGKLKSVA